MDREYLRLKKVNAELMRQAGAAEKAVRKGKRLCRNSSGTVDVLRSWSLLPRRPLGRSLWRQHPRPRFTCRLDGMRRDDRADQSGKALL
jgi:hypothetical protein